MFSRFGIYPGLPTAKSFGFGTHVVAVQRLPTDPYFYANVDTKNMVIGSRWVLGYRDGNGDLIELDTGVNTATDFTISNVPSYASPFLLELSVRKSSAATKYRHLTVNAYHTALGVTMYVSQVPNKVVD